MAKKNREDSKGTTKIKFATGKNKNLSSLRPDKVLAVVCADIHLSHQPPIARSAEPDWYAAMENPIIEMVSVADDLNCPIFISGDIFDRWNSPPELINFAIEVLRRMTNQPIYAIPGQHDLPNHVYEDKHRSAYNTLVQSGVIEDLPPSGYSFCPFHCLWYCGFPFGFEPKSIISNIKRKKAPLLGLVHRFVWSGKRPWPDCPKQNQAKYLQRTMKGFDIIVTGDNHIPFHNGKVFNCGGFMRRRFDEKNHEPSIGIILTSGEVVRYYLDCSNDKFADEKLNFEKGEKIDVEGILEQLSHTYERGLDFVEELQRAITNNNCSQAVKNLVLESVQKGKR